MVRNLGLWNERGLLGRTWNAVAWAAFAWAVLNCALVYLVFDGARTYRIETAVLVLAAVLAPLACAAALRTTAGDQSVGAARVLIAASLAAWVSMFLPLLHFPFLSDDYVFLAAYNDAADVTRASQFFRPLFAFVFKLLAMSGGGQPEPYHALAMALHVTSASCVYAIARRLSLSPTASAVAFLTFLLNPLQLEAVLWVAGLQESLWVCGILLALVVYTGESALRWWRLGLVAVLILSALLSKETAVCYILLFPAADLALFRFRRGPALPFAYACFLALLVAYLGVRGHFMALEPSYLVRPSTYFVKQVVTTPYRFFVMPWNPEVVSVPKLVPFVLSAGAICALFFAVAIRREPFALIAGVFLVAASTAPVYSYFFVREDLFSARYIYCASAGWALIVASAVGSAFRSNRGGGAAGLVLVAALSLTLTINLIPWHTAEGLIRAAEDSLKDQKDPSDGIRQWAAQNGIAVEFRGAVPEEYKGVGIFINGFSEFVQLRTPR